MAFRNRIRLPFYITRPQLPTTKKVFRLANGVTKVSSVIISKTYEGIVDYMPETMHECLKVALSHDVVNVESEKYIGGVFENGDYEIEWQEFLDFPIAQAKFKVGVNPYDFSNFNCQTCEEAMQLALEDDVITGIYDTIDEGDTVEYNVFENDSICCSPVTAQIMTTNAAYVQSASIDPLTGIVTIELLPTTPSGTNVNLLTYRVSCPNGQYDEADVFANVDGTEITCNEPDFLDAGTVTETSATPNWDWTLGAPANVDHFEYDLFLASNPGSPIDSGTTSAFSVNYTTLNPGTAYIFRVRTVCDDLSTSGYLTLNFSTPVNTNNCGRYLVFWTDGSGSPGGPPHIFSYLNCAGDSINDFITNLQSKLICTLENSPGNPIEIIGVTSYEYVEPCN